MNRFLPWAVAALIATILAAIIFAGAVDLSDLKDWQPLMAACVALLAAWIAYSNVNSTLRINLLSREEERLDREIPGIREARGLIDVYLCHFEEDVIPDETVWKSIMDMNGIEATRSTYLSDVENLLPRTSGLVRRALASRLLAINTRLAAIHLAEQSREKWPDDASFPDAVATSQAALRDSLRKFEETRNDLTAQIDILEARRRRIRQRINLVIDES